MSADTIYNAAPMVVNLGTQDLSIVPLPIEPETYPQHCPKFFLYTKKGPTTPQLVSSAHAAQLYGTSSFDVRQKYANYATVMYNSIAAQGNKCMLQRLTPADAGPAANITLWLDVLPVTINITQRNSDGSYTTDANGDVLTTGETSPGYVIKWVVTSSNNVDYTLGEQTIVSGDQIAPTGAVTPVLNDGLVTQAVITGTADVNGVVSVTSNVVTGDVVSTRYPIMEIMASSFGDWGNNVGINLWAPIQSSQKYPIQMTVLQQARAYPFYISVFSRPNAQTSTSVVPSIYGDNALQFTFVNNIINPLTNANMYLEDIFVSNYNNTTNPTFPRVYGDFNQIYVYEENIQTLLNMFFDSEVPFINQWSDFTSAPTDYALFNFVSCMSSMGAPYQTVIMTEADANSVSLTRTNNIYAAGSSDGTINDTLFAGLVTTEMAAYLDPESPVQDMAVNVESIMYDPGYPLATKQALCNFIAVRPDTFVALSTYTSNTVPLSSSEEYSLAIALKTQLQMFPESEYFGTPVMRGMIVGSAGKLINSTYTKYVPLLTEVAIKAARYMGASDYQWVHGQYFAGAPGSVITSMSNVTNTFVPPTAKNLNWSVGLNWVQSYDRRSFFFPAFKTVYDNDTSVLNSFFPAMAICTLNKINHNAWRYFSGVSNLTNAQLIERVNAFVTQETTGIFDNNFVIVPNAYMTANDVARGYSWHLAAEIYADNMKTVMTSIIQSYRMSSLPSSVATTTTNPSASQA